MTHAIELCRTAVGRVGAVDAAGIVPRRNGAGPAGPRRSAVSEVEPPPDGARLMTGTGIVAPGDIGDEDGDRVAMSIDDLGVLEQIPSRQTTGRSGRPVAESPEPV